MTSTKRLGLLALVAALIVGMAVAPAAMAATTTLAGDGTDEVTGFTASSSDYLEYSFASSGTDFGTDGTTNVFLNVSYDGVEHAETTSSVASGDTSYLFNLSHDELDTVPGQPGETTTVNVTAYGTDGSGTTTTGPTEFSVDLVFDSSRNVVYLQDSNSDLSIEAPEEPGFLSSAADTITFWSEEDEDPDIATLDTTRTISGSSTTITVFNEGTDLNDSLSAAAEGYTSSGDPILGMTVTADDEPIPVFYESADSDVVSTDNDTYAVYGDNTTEINLGDDYDGASSVDVYVESQDPLTSAADVEFSDVQDIYGDLTREQITDEFGWTTYVMSLLPSLFVGSSLLGGGLLIGLRRRRMEA